uniref:Glycoprotein M6Bb n=1 Tax=Cyprinus carpio TaxID=7962 RepID=A0A8C2C4E5_CYPCA
MDWAGGGARVIPAADVTRACTSRSRSWRVSVSVCVPLSVIKRSTVDATAAEEVLGRLKKWVVLSAVLNALTGTLTILENHFSKITADHAMLTDIIQLMQYVIYGIASFFFLYGIILLAEGFYTTSAVKELHSEFKTTVCGRCISGMFVFLTYILGIAWLGVFGFSAVPVFLFYNMWSTCAAMRSPMANLTSIDSICVDVRQYGIIPWNATPGKACGSTLGDICNTSEFYLSYHLYIVACAGAGATVIALLIYMMATTYNFAVLKFKSREDCCTKF